MSIKGKRSVGKSQRGVRMHWGRVREEWSRRIRSRWGEGRGSGVEGSEADGEKEEGVE